MLIGRLWLRRRGGIGDDCWVEKKESTRDQREKKLIE